MANECLIIGKESQTAIPGFSIIGQHIIERLSQLIRDLLYLQLFSVDLVLNVIYSLIKLCDVHLTKLKSRFSTEICYTF